MNRQLIKEDKEMTTKHMKICSTLCGIKELHIKIMSCHYIPLRMPNHPHPTPPKSLIKAIASENEEQQTLTYCYSKCKMVQLL